MFVVPVVIDLTMKNNAIVHSRTSSANEQEANQSSSKCVFITTIMVEDDLA